MNKTIRTIIFLGVFFLVMAVAMAMAEPELYIPRIQKDLYIYDDGYFIASNMEEELNERLLQLDWDKEIQFYIVTLENPGEISLGEYAYRLFVELGIGDNAVTGGILIVAADSQVEPVLVAGKKVKEVLYRQIRQKIIDDQYMVYNNHSNTSLAIEAAVNEILSVLKANAAQLKTFVTRQTALRVGIYALIMVSSIVFFAISCMLLYGIRTGDFELLIISLHFLFELAKLVVSVIFLFNFLRGISLKGVKNVLQTGQEKVRLIRSGGGGASRGGGTGRRF